MSDGRLDGKVAHFREEGSTWKLVYVVDHTLHENGRISNWVSFRYVNKNGSLGKSGGWYDWGRVNFKVVEGAKVITKVILPKEKR